MALLLLLLLLLLLVVVVVVVVEEARNLLLHINTNSILAPTTVQCKTDGCTTSSQLVKLPDLASIFTAEIWIIIKVLKQMKDSVASEYIIFTDSLSCV